MSSISPPVIGNVPDAQGRYGPFGGQYVPETLMGAVHQLESEYARARQDAAFWRELDHYLKYYVGRPSPLYFARRLTDQLGGAQIDLKREDVNHTGSH